MDKLLKKADVCDMLNISITTLDRIIAERSIPVYRVRGSIRFREADVKAYLEACFEPATPRAAAVKASRPAPVVIPACGYYPGMKVV